MLFNIVFIMAEVGNYIENRFNGYLRFQSKFLWFFVFLVHLVRINKRLQKEALNSKIRHKISVS